MASPNQPKPNNTGSSTEGWIDVGKGFWVDRLASVSDTEVFDSVGLDADISDIVLFVVVSVACAFDVVVDGVSWRLSGDV
jgi:hypothetical protein